MAIKSYSQLCEDIFLFNNYMNTAADLVCVEIGAFDGETYSNTLLFEQQCGAKSILIEPSPRTAAAIRTKRPKAIVHQFAVTDELSVAEFVGDSAVAGLSRHMTAEYQEEWGLGEKRKYPVLTVPASVALSINDLSYIDFLSIDIQGAELAALSTMDWRLPIGMLCVELEGHDPIREEKCREILRNAGFEFRQKLLISEIWINPNYGRAHEIFDSAKTRPLSDFDIPPYARKHMPKLQLALEY